MRLPLNLTVDFRARFRIRINLRKTMNEKESQSVKSRRDSATRKGLFKRAILAGWAPFLDGFANNGTNLNVLAFYTCAALFWICFSPPSFV